MVAFGGWAKTAAPNPNAMATSNPRIDSTPLRLLFAGRRRRLIIVVLDVPGLPQALHGVSVLSAEPGDRFPLGPGQEWLQFLFGNAAHLIHDDVKVVIPAGRPHRLRFLDENRDEF